MSPVTSPLKTSESMAVWNSIRCMSAPPRRGSGNTSRTARSRAGKSARLGGQSSRYLSRHVSVGLNDEGADVILTGRNPDRLKLAAAEVGAQRTAALDANDSDA